MYLVDLLNRLQNRHQEMLRADALVDSEIAKELPIPRVDKWKAEWLDGEVAKDDTPYGAALIRLHRRLKRLKYAKSIPELQSDLGRWFATRAFRDVRKAIISRKYDAEHFHPRGSAAGVQSGSLLELTGLLDKLDEEGYGEVLKRELEVRFPLEIEEIESEESQARESVKLEKKKKKTAVAKPQELINSHSDDFRSVTWNGQKYMLTKNQAACIRVLWKVYQTPNPELSQADILKKADVSAERLVDVFKGADGKRAFAGLINRVPKRRGLYQLAPADVIRPDANSASKKSVPKASRVPRKSPRKSPP